MEKYNLSPDQIDKLITTDELSKRLQIDKVTIWRLSKEGVIKGGRKIGRSVRFDWNQVLANFPEWKVG